MPGPRPTPTAVLKARGSWRAKEREGEPQPPAAKLDPPAWLSENGKHEWTRIAPELHALGLLTALDLAVLTLYCQALGDWKEAIEKIAETGGPIVKSPSGFPIQNPYVSLKAQAMKQLLAAAAELGLSPAARTRIKLQTAAPEQETGKSRFFKAR